VLFDRQIQTRFLCIVVVLGAIAFCVIMLTVLVAFAKHADDVLFDKALRIGLWVVVTTSGAFGLLWLWRKCDRCRRRLFTEGNRTFSAFNLLRPEHRAWIHKFWWPRASFDQERDYRAKAFMGSYRNAAIRHMALTGTVRCQWCGHMDGSKPDYVVVGRQ
jgi:hypothetical protein